MDSRWRTELGDEINMAPLLDVIFCLLFFFILATSLREDRKALDIELPQTSQSTQKIEPPNFLEIRIASDNRILFDGREVGKKELTRLLSEKAQATAPLAAGSAGQRRREVLIRTDGKADVQTFLSVSDACAEAGWRVARLETLPGKKPSDSSE